MRTSILFKALESMTSTQKKIAITGAGIAGLSLAYNLRKLNFEVKIFEQAPALTDTGLGFLIMSNGMEMFRKMGIEREMIDSGIEINYFKSVDHQSNSLKEKSIENCLSISRSKCIDAVYRELDKDVVCFDKEVSHYTNIENSNQKKLHFKDGSHYIADLIIAADGLNSNIRKQLYPNHPKIEVREKEIVGMAYHPELDKKLGNTMLKMENPKGGMNMGLLPFLNGKIIWYIQFNENKFDKPENNPESLKNFCVEICKNIPQEFKEVIHKSDFTRTFLWTMLDVEILPSFHKDNIMLIGDAAHPVLAFTSQGVNSALEDADLIAQLLGEYPEVTLKELYDRFDKIRKPVIESTLDGGRLLLDQFLYPEKYENFQVPFVDRKVEYLK